MHAAQSKLSFIVVPFRIPMAFCTELGKTTLKLVRKQKVRVIVATAAWCWAKSGWWARGQFADTGKPGHWLTDKLTETP